MNERPKNEKIDSAKPRIEKSENIQPRQATPVRPERERTRAGNASADNANTAGAVGAQPRQATPVRPEHERARAGNASTDNATAEEAKLEYEKAKRKRSKKRKRRRKKKGRRTLLLLVLLIIVAGLAYLNLSGHMDIKFRIVSDTDAFHETLVDQIDTGFETVWIATKGFEMTGDDVRAVIRTTTENDPEDLCIIPDGYEASYYSAVHLWKIKMNYSYSAIPTELADGSTDSSSKSNASTLTEEEVMTAQRMTSTALDEAVSEISQHIGASDRSKYKAIFEWVCKNVAYDEDLEYVVRLSNKEDPTIINRSLYGAMCKSTVCTGYAAAFKALCDRFGLECLVVEDAEGTYAWNAVICDENVLYVDPLGGAGAVDTAIDYFLRAPEDFSAEFGHEADPTYYIPAKFAVN